MAKARIFRLSIILACFVLLPNICIAHQLSLEARKKTVESFLHTWLVHKDVPAAITFFYERALTDGFVLDCRCCGEASNCMNERQNPEDIKRKVQLFLKEYSERIKGRTLSEILFLKSHDNPEDSRELAAKIGKRVLNQPKRDKYYLVDYGILESKDEALEYFGKRYDLNGAFFSVIQYRVLNEDVRYGDDLIVHLLWVRDKGEWKIVNVGVACN